MGGYAPVYVERVYRHEVPEMSDRIREAREHLAHEKSRIAKEEGERAAKHWDQFFPGLARLEFRCLCATLVALEHIKKP